MFDDVEGNDLVFTRWYSDRGDTATWKPGNVDNMCVTLDPQKHYMWTDSNCTQLHAFVCQQG